MTHTPPASLRALAETAETHTVALAPKVLEVLLDTSLGATPDPANRTALQAAQSFLGEALDTGLTTLGEGLPPRLADKRDTLATRIAEIAGDLPPPGAEAPAPLLAELARRTRADLQPAVAEFLGALFDHVVAREKEAAQLVRGSDADTVEQIDLITSKINLIAINASVEAARAGEAGRGFAVIAAEIQELSRQSKEALGRIRAKIN